MTDAQLLDRYTTSGDREALGELVRRHIDFVYSSARRQTHGDRHLAEDVVQVVFIILSQKARSIRRDSPLAGWLFNTTRYAALNAIKMEVRRRKHEQEAAAIRQETMETAAPDEALVWEKISPELDRALAKLGQADREVVLLRYLKGMRLDEVAKTMGVTTAAAQKRVSRAIHKLRAELADCAPALSGGMLVTMLTNQAMQVAPAHLAAAVTEGTLGGAAAVTGSMGALVKGTLAMMTWTQIKLAASVASVVLLAAGTASTVVLAELKGNSTAPAAVMQTSASNPSLDPNFPDLVGARLRTVVNVSLKTDQPASKQEIYEQSYVTIAWQIDPETAKSAASYIIQVFNNSGDANKDPPDSSKKVWGRVLKDPSARWIDFGAADQGQDATLKPWSLRAGNYWVVMSVLDAQNKQITSAQGLVDLTVNPLIYSQLEIDDIQADGTILSHGIQQYMNDSDQPATTLGFMTSDFVTETAMTDEDGKPIRFTTRHDAERRINQYRASFNKQIPPGDAVLFSSDATMKGLVRKVGADEWEYRFHHNPGSNETRCLRIYRLPKGATLVSTSLRDLPQRMKDRRVEVSLEKVVPENGGINAVIRYRLADANGL